MNDRLIALSQIEKLRPSLLDRLRRRGVANPADREDIVQDALAKLCRQSKSTAPVPVAYVWRALADALAGHRRLCLRRVHASTLSEGEPPETNVSEFSRESDYVDAILQTLSQHDSDLVRLRYLKELSLLELVRHFRKSRKTICNRLRQAIETLQQRFGRLA